MSLLDLPDDLISHVMSFAEEPQTVCRQQLTCKQLAHAGRANAVWRTLYQRQWRLPGTEPPDWYSTYADAYAARDNIVAGRSQNKRVAAHVSAICCLHTVGNESGDFITAGKDGYVKYIDAESGQIRYSVKAHAAGHAYGRCLCMTNDRLWTGAPTSVQALDLTSGSLLREFKDDSIEAKHRVYCIQVDTDGRVAASLSSGSAFIWDVQTGHTTATLQGESSDVAWSLQLFGAQAVTGDWSGNVVLWDTITGKSIMKKTPAVGEKVMDVHVVHPYLFVAGRAVRIFDLRTGEMLDTTVTTPSVSGFRSFFNTGPDLLCVPFAGAPVPLALSACSPRAAWPAPPRGTAPASALGKPGSLPSAELALDMLVQHGRVVYAAARTSIVAYDAGTGALRANIPFTGGTVVTLGADDFRLMCGTSQGVAELRDFRGRHLRQR